MSSKQYFDDVADRWDQMRRAFFPDEVRDAALNAAQVTAGKVAADIGAGTGFITEALLAAGLRVIAVDQSPAMLEVMKDRFGAENLTYHLGSAEALPIEANAVDYAFANMYLHHVEDPAVAIREMARTLAPGGTLVITDLDEHDYLFLAEEQHDRWLGFKREDVQRWFEEAGLSHVAVQCVGSNCCTTSGCGTQQAQISIFIATGVKNS